MAIDTKGKILLKDFSQMSNEEKLEQATVFSEGSEELKKILLLLWDCGIQTLGCCAGHEDNSSMPYVAFNIENIEETDLIEFLIELTNDKNGVKQVTFNAGTISSYPVFDDSGNVIKEEQRHKPATINLLIEESFEKSNVYNIIQSILKQQEESKINLNDIKYQDKKWINDIVKMRDIKLEELNFFDYVNNVTDIKRVKGLDAKVTFFTINRDNKNVTYNDNYSIILDNFQSRDKTEARILNSYLKVIPTGSSVESAEDRIKFYEKVANYKPQEKELE